MLMHDHTIGKIRPATLADVNVLNALVNSAYRGETSKKGWTTEADLLDGTRIDEAALHDLINKKGTTVLCYETESTIKACVELREEEDKLYLGMLSVSPGLQGSGIGKVLLKEAEFFAKEKGLSYIYMTVISVRAELIAWYQRHGYQVTGERKPFVVPDIRWGIPKQPLEFVVLRKPIL
ncbi:MAG: GNAT family N-acetyltransferase [Chryseotalea sp.]|jgi:ribosomal protein S18 acetylase RimI-like enzyme